MNKLSYFLFRLFVGLMKLIPFGLLYVFAHIVYFFYYHVFSYRKTTVLTNIKNSFPSLNANEQKKLCKQFYHHLSNITVESIKGYSMSHKQLLRRFKIENPEILDSFYSQNKNIIAIASHYGNWEWGIAATGLQLKHECFALYMPIKNKYIEKYLINKRARGHMHLTGIENTRVLFEEKKKKPALMIMAADQSPSNVKKAIWIEFLNQETGWLHGPESYARRYNWPVVYFKINKLKKGYYSMSIEIISEKPFEQDENHITKKYAHLLERDIKEAPQYWLWSHKRWKRKRPPLLHSNADTLNH